MLSTLINPLENMIKLEPFVTEQSGLKQQRVQKDVEIITQYFIILFRQVDSRFQVRLDKC